MECIVIKKTNIRSKDKVELICRFFGFYTKEGKAKLAYDIIKHLHTFKNPVTATELSRRLSTSRGAVINQLYRLMNAGIVIKKGKYYYLRNYDLSKLIKEIKRDVIEVFSELEEILNE